MTMAGISSKALAFGSPENKLMYNGKEEQREEFSDGSGLEWLDYGARMYDYQIGRWFKIDNKAELYLNITPYSYAANQPVNAIDINGDLIIFVNGFTMSRTEKGTGWYWREWETQHKFEKNEYGEVYSNGPKLTGRAFDIAVAKHLNDFNLMYVDGHHGLDVSDRRRDGKAKGYKDAPAIIESLHRTNGVVDESIKIITHSMGAVYADAYIKGIEKYLDEHPEYKKDIKITLVADFDPFQAGSIKNDGKRKKQQYLHKGKGSLSGGLANEKEQNPENYELFESPTEGSHSIMSFFNEISNLKEGKYVWNEKSQQFELVKEE
jgi:RHS repeat-associated protein